MQRTIDQGYGAGERTYCAPEQTGMQDLVNTFITYVNNHPNDAAVEAFSVIFSAITERWPCK